MKTPAQYDESRLLSLLGEGNEIAFNEIYCRYSPVVYKEAFRFLRSSELTDDLVQEIFTTVWDKRERFTDVDHLRAYLITMCKNLVYRYLLKISRETSAKKEFASRMVTAENSTENAIHGKELEVLLEKTVKMLPRQQREVFNLAKGKGMSYTEIAKKLDISPNTVKNHMISANRFIRNVIDHSPTTILLFVGLLIP